MEMVAIPEKHDRAGCGVAEVLLRHEEWYSVIGDIAGICLDLLKKSKEKLQRNVPLLTASTK
jgi:hypothetical protein